MFHPTVCFRRLYDDGGGDDDDTLTKATSQHQWYHCSTVYRVMEDI